MKLKATLVLLIWTAPLVTPLIPAQAECEMTCCGMAGEVCPSAGVAPDCLAMATGAAEHTLPVVPAALTKGGANPAIIVLQSVNGHQAHDFPLDGIINPAPLRLSLRFIPLII
ncbi:MAG: hypothetical protein V3U35_03740 [Candidatus Neomarinimicrobiota bacterium]